MEFNKNWTKEDNEKLLKFSKNGISIDHIREYFGNDKLFYHPNKKYHQSGKSAVIPNLSDKIKDFSGFINEIKYEPLKTDFTYDFEKSEKFEDQFNYIYKFQTNYGNQYIIDFIYLNDVIGPYSSRDIYNISFTIELNRNIQNYKDYEKQTLLNEQHEIIKRVIFVFRDFDKRFGKGSVYMLGETEDKRKVNWYRDLIKSSFDDVIETEGISSYTNGLKAYYYEIKSNEQKNS